ncbi:hypothetical protein Pla123a_35050 [Posidoniimonas polymericola]|uniref:Haem-binding uptake Tiki superfamily ChaN domain-containing protein n=1 Tax=Posidoniimonas polymericola TaxID=2528002 RepID=A0A5C5YIJ5_9BACT|nr:hypothetical protein [Posidoniimonas polymericola]TWT74681.1 hypothetical protein Pla123a_35050 [Posidoniimonas polymericola]
MGQPVVFWIASVLALSLLGSPHSAGAEPTQVVVVGTQHFLTDMPAGFTPGHLRAFLVKAEPDLLAVEAPFNAPDPWSYAPYELSRVTKPWADQLGLAVEQCDWLEPTYQLQLGQWLSGLRTAGHGVELQRIEAVFQAKNAQPLTFELANSDANYELWRRYHADLQRLAVGKSPWQARNDHIVENVCKLAEQHRGQRIAVVFGAAHAYYLVDHLAGADGVEVIPAGRFLPLTDAEVQEHTHQEDHLQALRLLNFGAVGPQQLDKCAEHLAHLEGAPEFAGDYLLFHGKLLLHQGKPADALTDFNALAESGGDAVSRFDGASRLGEAARVYAAIALSQQGESSAARERLEAVAADESVTTPTRQWARQLLAAAPTATD